MNRFFAFTGATVLMTASISAAYAAPNSGDQLSVRKAKHVQATLALMDQQIADISDTALLMNRTMYQGADDFDFQADQLADLRSQVNGIGHELAVIEAERSSLPQWQTATVDQVLPIMHEIATESTQAINTYNANKIRLFASDYGVETNEVSSNAEKAAHLLHGDIKLANDKAVEGRLTAAFDEQTTAGTK